MSISLNNFTCPHCLRENATLFCTAKFTRPIKGFISTVFTCKSCDQSMIVDFDDRISASLISYTGSGQNAIITLDSSVTINGESKYGVYNYYPKPELPTIPEHLSDAVSKNLREAKELFSRKYFNQSGMTSRRVIDLATKELLPEHTGMLNSRIKQLRDNNIITEQISDWADIVKLGGNSATHDYDDFTEQEAKQLLDFTEMFLMYTFTLPSMVELKRHETTDDATT